MGQVRRQPNRRAIATNQDKEKHNGSGEASAEPSCPLRPTKIRKSTMGQVRRQPNRRAHCDQPR